MTMVAVVFDAKQPCIFHIGIRQHIAGCCAVHKPPFYQKPDKPALRDIQLFGGLRLVLLKILIGFMQQNQLK